ncbi:MAG: hypothetical protein HYY23_13285 [Verrucomicrobia bacterium]|nr:hypothetical protein [Verrucomicrobiota bacterium]
MPEPELIREGGSEKHLRDIRSMLAVSGDQLNRLALEEWIHNPWLGGAVETSSCLSRRHKPPNERDFVGRRN